MESRTAEGHLRDLGPNGLHGVVRTWTRQRGPLGDARTFSTVHDRVDLPEAPQLALDGPLTVATVVRVTTTGIHQHVVACDDKFALWITADDQLRFVDTLGHGAQSTTAIEANRWLVVVAVFDGTKHTELTSGVVRLYVDGKAMPTELVNAANDTTLRWLPGPLYPTDSCYIGFESHQGESEHQQLPFVGAIDELLLYRRAWSDAEVSAYVRAREEAVQSTP